jgi:DNA-binding beta-propeller fold protein YncE
LFGFSAFSQSAYADDGIVDVQVPLVRYVSVATQETAPQAVAFKPDGLRMYVLGLSGRDVNEYVLSTPWVVSTASYVQNTSVASQDTSPVGLFFKPDGTKMYVLGSAGDKVYEYDLSLAWVITTASYLQSFSVVSQDPNPSGLSFKPDGTKMYVTGGFGQDINEYNLSTAWDVTTASYLQNYSVVLQDTQPKNTFFKPDGTKMYVVGFSGRDVNEYNLSTAWDVTTASYSQNFVVQVQETSPLGIFFRPDGGRMYVVGTSSDRVNEYDLSLAWDISTATTGKTAPSALTGGVGSATATGDAVTPATGLEATSAVGSVTVSANAVVAVTGVSSTGAVGSVTVSADAVVPTTGLAATGAVGSVTVSADAVVAVTGVSSTGAVGSVTVTGTATVSLSPYASVATQETAPQAVFFKPDGLRMYVSGLSGRDVNEYALSTPWVVSTATAANSFSVQSQDITPVGLFFKPDGTKMYVLGSAGDKVYEYDLSLAWLITTASYLQSFSVAAQDSVPSGLFFKPDGTKMYVTGALGDEVNEYDLSTAWDVTTASYLQTYSVSSQDTNPQNNFFKPDGTKMYVVGQTGRDINEYDLGTAWDVTTASYVQNFVVQSQEATPVGLFFETYGSKMFVVGSSSDKVHEYDLSTNWDISTANYSPLPASAPAGDVGSVTATGDAVVPTTGLEATSAVGSVTVAADAVVAVTGVSSTGEVGSVTVSADAVVSVTGVSATGEVGSPTVTGDAVVPTTGLEATSAVGSVTVAADAVVSVTGVSATGEVGSVTVTGTAVVSPTGVSATGEVGSPTVTGDAVVPTTGLEATSAVGSVTVAADAVVAVTGVSSTGEVGSVTVTGTAVVSPTGVSATGEVGSPTVTGDAVVPTTGLEATSAVGSVTVSADAVVSVTGVSSTGEVGSVTVTGTAVVPLTGVSSTGEVGSVTVKASATVIVAGVSAEGLVGQVLVWSHIVPDPGTEYTDITPEATSTWTDLEPSAITSWTKIAA